jgi:hypothetical protein
VDPDAILAAGTSGPDRAPVDADAILAAGLQQSAGMQRSRRPSRRFASSFRPVKPAWMQ